MKIDWPALAIATLFFFIVGLATDRLQDILFFSHTSIQDGVEICRGEDCWNEDGVRAYNSQNWAYIGNAFTIFTLAVRGLLSLVIYVILEKNHKYNLLFLLLFPAALALIALLNMPHEFYRALRIAMLICCGFLAIAGWNIGIRFFTIPLAICAIAYNPLFEFHLSRDVWLPINIATSAFLLALAVIFHRAWRNVT